MAIISTGGLGDMLRQQVASNSDDLSEEERRRRQLGLQSMRVGMSVPGADGNFGLGGLGNGGLSGMLGGMTGRGY
jgi:hypothetical protein